MLTFEMPALPLEMPAPLVVDHPRDGIGEMAPIARWVVDGQDTDGLDLDHPAGAEPR
jgi:hypothetical protein